MQNGLPGADLIEAGVIDLREGRETVARSEEHTSELQSQSNLVCRLLLEKKKTKNASAKVEFLPRSRIYVGAVRLEICAQVLAVGVYRCGRVVVASGLLFRAEWSSHSRTM